MNGSSSRAVLQLLAYRKRTAQEPPFLRAGRRYWLLSLISQPESDEEVAGLDYISTLLTLLEAGNLPRTSDLWDRVADAMAEVVNGMRWSDANFHNRIRRILMMALSTRIRLTADLTMQKRGQSQERIDEKEDGQHKATQVES